MSPQRHSSLVRCLLAAALVLSACGSNSAGPYVPSTNKDNTSTSPLATSLQFCLLPAGAQSSTPICSQLGASPAYIPSVNLGAVAIDSVSWVQLDIQNKSSDSMLLAPLAFEGTPPTGLQIIGGWTDSKTLPAAQTASVFIYFKAAANDPATFESILDVTFEGATSPAVKIPIFAVVGSPDACAGSPPTPSFVVEQNGGLVSADAVTGAYDFNIPEGMSNVTVNFDASQTKPSSGVQFKWSVVSASNNSAVQFSSTDGAHTSIEFTAAGIYVVSLTVSENNGACVAPVQLTTLSVTAG